MQRSIFRLAGACGLIFTFTTAAQTAGGGGAAGGASAGGTIAAGAAGGRASAPVAVSPSARATTAVTATPPATTARPQPTIPTTQAQNNGPVAGQSVSPAAGQNTTIAPPTFGAAGQPVQGQPPGVTPSGVTATTSGTTIGATGSQIGATTTTGIAATTGIGSAATTRTTVSFNSLPATVQSQIAAQIPAGAQLGAIVAETTAQGTTFRAQVMQNGIISELALGGFAPGTALATGVATTGIATTTGTLPNAIGGFVVGTAYPFEQLPASVQSAFAAQGAAGATNVTFTPSGSGGVFHAMVDGRPIDIRVAPNGQVLPISTRAIAGTTASTNALRLEDLPLAVRDAIRTSTPFAEVTSIRKSESASGDLYDITMRNNDQLTMMRLSENGTIITAKHDLAAEISAAPVAILTNEPPKLAWSTLPVAVRDAISVQTPPEAIKALVLTNYEGKTAYAVDYTDKNAIRNRLYIGKEGVVVDTQTNLFGIAMTGKPVILDDLPAPARSVVEREAERSAVTRIDLAMQGLTPVYVISFQRDGELRQMVVSRDGRRVDSAVGAPAVSVSGSETTRAAETKPTEVK